MSQNSLIKLLQRTKMKEGFNDEGSSFFSKKKRELLKCDTVLGNISGMFSNQTLLHKKQKLHLALN